MNILFSERTEQSKLKIVLEMKKIIIFFKQTFNVDIFLIYGTLLGAIRDKDFIAHDKDIDLAYISKYSTKKERIMEFNYITTILKQKGLLKRVRGHKHLDCKALDDKIVFDIWESHILNNKLYLAPFILSFDIYHVLPLQSITFKGEIFNVPKNSEYILDNLYYTWKIPLKTNFRKFNY